MFLDELIIKLNEWLKKENITQAAAAKRLGMTRIQLNRILNKKSGTTLKRVEQIYKLMEGEDNVFKRSY